MPRARSTSIAALLLGLLAVTASACTSEDGESETDFADLSAEEIATDALVAMDDLEGVRLTGAVDSGGTLLQAQLLLTPSGDCTGTIGLEDGTAELLGVDGRVWFRPDREFWLITAGTEELADQLLAVTGDRWVGLPQTNTTYAELCDLDRLIALTFGDADTPFTKGSQEAVNGQDAVGVVSQRTDSPAATGFVALEEPHRLLRIVGSGVTPTDVIFSDFGTVPDVEAPSLEGQIPLEELQSSVF
jgi:hypothetical protein